MFDLPDLQGSIFTSPDNLRGNLFSINSSSENLDFWSCLRVTLVPLGSTATAADHRVTSHSAHLITSRTRSARGLSPLTTLRGNTTLLCDRLGRGERWYWQLTEALAALSLVQPTMILPPPTRLVDCCSPPNNAATMCVGCAFSLLSFYNKITLQFTLYLNVYGKHYRPTLRYII